MNENNQNAGNPFNPEVQSGSQYEIIDCVELARRWCLPESWVRGHAFSNASPIPLRTQFVAGAMNRMGTHQADGGSERAGEDLDCSLFKVSMSKNAD